MDGHTQTPWSNTGTTVGFMVLTQSSEQRSTALPLLVSPSRGAELHREQARVSAHRDAEQTSLKLGIFWHTEILRLQHVHTQTCTEW